MNKWMKRNNEKSDEFNINSEDKSINKGKGEGEGGRS